MKILTAVRKQFVTVLLFSATLTAQRPVSGPIIQTFAGADFTFQSEGQPAVNAPFGQPQDVNIDAAGNIYFVDVFYQAYRINPDGTVRLLAGNGFRGFPVDGFEARSASFFENRSITRGPDGNVYIGIGGFIKKILPNGTVAAVAGGGPTLGDGGPATKASIGDYPLGIIFDRSGNLIFADARNGRVRRIDTNGNISTIAGNGQDGSDGDGAPAVNAKIGFPRGARMDAAGNLYIPDSGAKIRKITPDGIISTFASGVSAPNGLDFDAAGNLYVADFGLQQVLKFSPDGKTRTVLAGTGIAGFSGDGGPATQAQFNAPLGLKVDAAGNVLVADSRNGRIRRISAADGRITTIAGNGQYRVSPDGTPATVSYFQETYGLAFSPAGLLHVSDRSSGSVYRIEADGTRTRVAGTGTRLVGGNGPAPARSTGMVNPQLMTFDRQGNLYIADDLLVRRVTPAGIMTTFAGGGGASPTGGGPATAVNLFPQGVFADNAGNVFIAESNDFASRIDKVTPDGNISVVAGNGLVGLRDGPAAQAQFAGPAGMALDAAGNLYVADQGNGRVRKITPGGIVSTFAGGGTADPRAGGLATNAQIGGPFGIRFDASGALLIAGPGYGGIFRVTPDGNISVIAGDGRLRFAGDGGPAILASLYFPTDVAVDAAGNIYVADSTNARVRVILAALPSIGATPASLSFTVRAGDPAPAPQQAAVTGSQAGLPFTISTSAAFLSATASSTSVPATIAITVNPGTLAPGSYSGTVTLTPNVAGVAPATIGVSLTVQAALPSQLTVDTAGLSFSFVRGGAAATRRVVVSNSGGGTLNFTAVAQANGGGSWLTVAPASGSVSPATPLSLTVTATPGTLAPNTYTGTITLTSGATTIVIPVTMTVSNSGQSIRLSQAGLTFLAVAGAGVTPPQSVVVLNTGQGSFSFTARAILPAGAPSWLTVTPSSGTVDSSQLPPILTIGVNQSGLTAGDYYGRVQVVAAAADNSPQDLTVVLRVLPASTDPGPVVQPSGLIFTGIAGGSDPPSQRVNVTNLTNTGLTFGSGAATLDGGSYVQYLPTSAAVSPGSLSLVVKPVFSGLAAGIYRGAITLVFSSGSIQTIGILIVIAPAGTVISEARGATSGCTPKQLLPLITSLGSNFNVPAAFPTALEVKVVDDCGAPSTSGSVVTSFSNGDLPLSLTSLNDGSWSATWVNRNTSSRSVSITATAENPVLQLRGSIQTSGGLSGDATPPLIGSGGIVSASSFAAQAPLAPGAFVSIYGSRLSNGSLVAPRLPLETQLAGTTVIVGGLTAPLLFSSDGQVNALLPLGLPANTRTQMIVMRGNQFSVPEEILIAPAQPGIFSTASSGKGQGHIYVAQANGTLVLADRNNPAKAGDTLVIYTSGLGAVDSAVTDGAAAPTDRLVRTVNPVTATIGGVTAGVGFGGLAPGFAVGLYQVNVTVPTGVAAGDAVPLVLTVAGQSSTTVTLAVR